MGFRSNLNLDFGRNEATNGVGLLVQRPVNHCRRGNVVSLRGAFGFRWVAWTCWKLDRAAMIDERGFDAKVDSRGFSFVLTTARNII